MFASSPRSSKRSSPTETTAPPKSCNYLLTVVGFCSTVVSAFAIIILSALAALYRSGHEEFAGTLDDPPPEKLGAIAGTIFTAVIVYAVGLLPARSSACLPLGVSGSLNGIY